MPNIRIVNLYDKIVPIGDGQKSVLYNLHSNGVDWMHSCGGKGRCTTCKMIVLDGSENVSEVTPAEERYRKIGALEPCERLTCQVRVTGNISIEVPEQYQLPHVKYGK